MKNMNSVVRLQSIELKNFKNITNGKIVFESYEKKWYLRQGYNGEILGIYGPNGSFNIL